MPKEDAVKRLGRVEYIEPNDIFPGKITNGIPQPYEDYSFSVNLRVINGNRYDCGTPSNGDDIANRTIEFSSDRGTLSFMDGTSADGGPGYLTTNFTDISMNDPDTNTKECLGIENISIKYDSWYYPTVDIKFVDVRGASLMQPAEYEYYNNGGPNLGKNASTSNSDFFKAFFSFPYPLFKLSVKGFYGKEVTYDLSVLKCNVEFNSSTGNFEVNASFIGYMYGMYGDLPFPFVYLAPYIDLYGKNTFDEKRQTGDFCYLSTDDENPIGSAMYTFPELKRVIDDATIVAKKVVETSKDGEHEIELKKLYEELEQKVLPYYPTSTKNLTWWSWTKTNKDGYFFISLDDSGENNRKIFNDFVKFASAVSVYNSMAADTKHYKGSILNQKGIFEKIYTETKRITNKSVSEYTDDEIKKILSSSIASLAFHKKEGKDRDSSVLIFDSEKSNFGSAEESAYKELIEELKLRFTADEVKSPMHKNLAQKEWTIRAFKLEDFNFKQSIVDLINDLKKKFKEYKAKADKLREQTIEDTIGFAPTIRNLYNMVFAHIDTFMSTFYNTLDRIRTSIQSSTDNSRKYKELCGGNIQVDVNDNTLNNDTISNGGKLPPFTMFYREVTEKDSEDKKVEMVWPGSLKGGDQLDEVKLVESIINATAMNKKSYEPVTPKHNIIPREGNIAPINYYDLIRMEEQDIHSNGNPYLDILNEKTLSDENVVRAVVRTFILRCFYSMLNGSYVAPDPGKENDGSSSSDANFTKKAKLIANLEVGNIERAFKILKMSPSQNFILELLKISNDGDVVMSDYIGGDKPMFTMTGINTLLKYCWIKNGDTYNFLPVGTFLPSIVENYLSGANLKKQTDKFLKITNTGTEVNGIYATRLYSGGKTIEKILDKYGSGDFVLASKLFPNYKTLPKEIADIPYYQGTFESATVSSLYERVDNCDLIEDTLFVPSIRKTEAGITNIFMDPLYYSQTSNEARAYLFLMGIPYGKDKEFFLPERVNNGDYPTLMLLREGAIYWRNTFDLETNDPIKYKYTINGNVYDSYPDIELNDPCFGKKYPQAYDENANKNSSIGRQDTLIEYFLKWANGVATTHSESAVDDAPYTIPEIPFAKMNFQTIEKYMALWVSNKTEGGVLVNTLLSSGNCELAVSAESVSTFANSKLLSDIYSVGSDGKLGKVNGKIRTDVVLRKTSTNENAEAFLKNFKVFYVGFDTIIDFSCLDNPNKSFTVPRNAMNDAVSAFVKGLKNTYKVSEEKIKELKETDSSGKPADKDIQPEQFKSDDLKLACYMALKSMYDRWLCSRKRDSWFFSCDPAKMKTNKFSSDFTRFFYIDEFYHNIGMQVRPNLTNFIENICKLGGFTEKTNEENLAATSIMKILSTTAQYAGCALLTLPTMLGLAKSYSDDRHSIEEVFKAFPYNDAVTANTLETSFVVLYSNQKSSMLDVPDDTGTMGYKTDGFDIANTWGEIVPQPMFADNRDEDGFVVPCFGVTFAKQNQSYFKDIRLSMEDHQVTEFSIRNEVMISYQSNKGPRETTMLGQDLYSVYSNYSYSCNVSMMGDAQITPLMYFQLNNIAMWKGAYLITNVHHDISVHGMETQFTGVRQARPSVPFKNDTLDVPAGDDPGQTPQSEDKTKKLGEHEEESLDISQRPLDRVDVNNVSSAYFTLSRNSVIEGETDDTLTLIKGTLKVDIIYNNGYRISGETIEIANTVEGTHAGDENERYKIEDVDVSKLESGFSLPKGRYGKVALENSKIGMEYRSANDSFFSFTDGKHIMITDSGLKGKESEIIIGETEFNNFKAGELTNICFGGASPIMLYPIVLSVSIKSLAGIDLNSESRAIYQEVFNFVKKMNDTKKPLTLLVTEPDSLLNTKIG